jgi:uncharacterized membrane protein
MRKWYPLMLIAVTLVVSVVLYPKLPERVATHFDIHGEANGWSSRGFAAFFVPGILVLTWGLLRWLPSIDPRRANYDKFQETYDLVVNAILTLVAGIHVMVLGVALGWPVPVARIVPVGVGALLLVLGNVLPRARPNWWFGVRTPWTLSSDTVWTRTHRMAGYLLTAAGVMCASAAVLPPRWTVALLAGSVGVASLGSVVYSYFAWRDEQP